MTLASSARTSGSVKLSESSVTSTCSITHRQIENEGPHSGIRPGVRAGCAPELRVGGLEGATRQEVLERGRTRPIRDMVVQHEVRGGAQQECGQARVHHRHERVRRPGEPSVR